MFKLIEKIKENSQIAIHGKNYGVLAKVFYITESETEKWYAKIQLENHYVLVISPYDDYMYFGYVGEAMDCDFPTPDTIEFEGSTYKKEADDYQMVKEFVFGDYLAMEGEVNFSDYSFGDKIISLGLITRTGKRADVYAEVVEITDIEVK
ncbi:MAG: hypothetical protein K2P14_02750 [Anaeroplasmataceae bacterium]|nr:hypothetical protein [Anaeroplasmataceae bacterium]